MRIGYHASHEQIAPSDLLGHVRLAERAGFAAAMCSDHFNPWSERQGHSGFAWSWLGAALEATRLTFGTVTAPGQRYHPAVVAQAAATLGQMYPGRFWLALGSGEFLNEHVTGDRWPSKPERHRRLLDSVDAIRRLLAGEMVSQAGVTEGHRAPVHRAQLFVRPEVPVPLYGAALTPETAEWAGGWADGLIMAPAQPDQAVSVMEAFRRGGGEGKPVLFQVAVSYAATDRDALAAAHEQWRNVALAPTALSDLPSPQAFDAAVADVRPEEVRRAMLVSSDPAKHARHLREFAALGPEAIYVHNVSRQQHAFIEAYRREVIPEFEPVARLR